MAANPDGGAAVARARMTHGGARGADSPIGSVVAEGAAAAGGAPQAAASGAPQAPTGVTRLGGRTGRRLVDDAALPAWMRPVMDRVDGATLPGWVLHATEPAQAAARRSAVLMLLGAGPDGPDLLLTERSVRLRAHAGQPAFPGGALEPGEGPVAAALREANEETGLDPDSVIPAAVLPALYLRPSHFLVRPVLAHWRTPGPVRPVDPAETDRVVRVPLADLADPAHRGTVVLRPGGDRGLARELRTPAFDVAGLVVWGFTAGLVDLLLDWGGWARPWDRTRMLAPAHMADVAADVAAGAANAAGAAGAAANAAGAAETRGRRGETR